MNVIQALIIGIIQGATEFIPISSSAHLVLIPWLLNWPSPGLAFDTVLHLGTLMATLTVLWPDLASLAIAWWHSIAGRQTNPTQAKLAWWIILGTIPTALMGVLGEETVKFLFHSPLFVSASLLANGFWLALADRFAPQNRAIGDLNWWQTLLIGIAQGCAIAPGISRSGATIGAGLLLGLQRDATAQFSFLLATPTICGAGLLQIKRLLEAPSPSAGPIPLIVGFLASFLSGYGSIHLLLAYLRKHGLSVFAVYCWFVGLLALLIILC